MATPKEVARQALESLPDDASFEDIMYRLYVRESIERGLEDARAGRVISQQEVERRMRELLGK